MTAQVLIISDSETVPQIKEGVIYLWKGRSETETAHSLLHYVEENAERLRAKYLAWIHDLGETLVGGQRLIDRLAFEDGLSYWWMTLLVEKSSDKSPISEAMRLLALEEIICKANPNEVQFFGNNQLLHECISGICAKLGIQCKWNRIPGKKARRDLRSLYSRLPNAIRALPSLLWHVLTHWSLKKVRCDVCSGGDKTIFLCSYFIHLDQSLCSKGIFYSRQWEALPTLLQKNGFCTNWIHHYLKNSVVQNTGVAVEWVNRFNQEQDDQGFHTFLDTFLSWRVVLRVIGRWLGLLGLAFRLRKLSEALGLNDSHSWLWPLMERDWYLSLCGPMAVSNLFWIELFDSAIRDLPHQRIGLYLYENLNWERAFIHAWRKYGHGRLLAVAHSTVRFWDLTYFSDPRTLNSTEPYIMPQPDAIVLNGEAEMDAFSHAGQPMDKIVKGEALRYPHLTDFSGRRLKIHSAQEEMAGVLILGDLLAESTRKMLDLLDCAAPMLSERFNYTVKPHPNCMVRAEDYPRLKLTIVADPLGKIMQNYDIAYASNSTSAGLDAYLSGMPLVVMLDPNELNMSPLRGQTGVHFTSTPSELAKALEAANTNANGESIRKDFFFLDPELSRWRRLLGLQVRNTTIDDRSE